MSGVCVSEWLFECTVQKLVLVITSLETNDVLERWQFDIECDKSAKESRSVTDSFSLVISTHLSLSLPLAFIVCFYTVGVPYKSLRWRC